jgi:hypothetical protein
MLRVILLSMLSALALANPSGTYSGSVTKLGQTVNAQVEVASDTSLNLSLSGILELDCAAEAYHLDGSSVTLDNLSDADDCIAKTLSEENVELKTIVYDEDADTITVSVKYVRAKRAQRKARPPRQHQGCGRRGFRRGSRRSSTSCARLHMPPPN